MSGTRTRRSPSPARLVPILLLLFTTGCATQIRVNMLQPAAYHEASLTKVVAVLPFDGPGGAEFAAEMEGVLNSINIDDKPYFTLVDRASSDKTVSELKLSQSGLIDPKTAVKIGRLVGAQGIYTGVVGAYGWQDTPFKAKRSECVKREVRRGKDGRLYEGACIRWRTFYVNCIKRTASISGTPKLVEVETGRVLYARNLSGAAESSGCEDTRPAADGEALFTRAKETAQAQFRRDIAPYYVTREITLMDTGDGITAPEAKEKLKQGIAYAGKGRLDMACELWGAARILSPDAVAIQYNLGVCAESRGDFEAALRLYRQADRLLGKPDDNITLALNRAGQALQNQKKLKEQLQEE
jgi:hypothetical protein